MGNKKKDILNKVRIEFIGNNTTGVTGSCIHVQFFDKDLNKNVQILLELGSTQDKSILENYKANDTLLNKFDAKNIDFVIINHVHADHFILIPALIPKQFTGKVLMTRESKAISPVMLYDAQYINELECKWLKEKKSVKAKPYYRISDILQIEDLIETIELNKIVNITPNIQIRFLPSKHILGSVTCELFFKDMNSRVHKLFYSSDLGNTSGDKYFVYDTQFPPSNATIAIYESTYGSRVKCFIDKKVRKKELEILKNAIKHTVLEKNGSCLFPCFSLDRTPNILKNIKIILDSDEELKNIPVIVDGKLTNELLDIYSRICENQNKENIEEILEWQNLLRIRAYKETLHYLDLKEPRIILSSAGFMSNGHVLEWAKSMLPQKRNTIIFTGYSPDGSVASKIKHKDETQQKRITIDKSTVLMNCDVVSLDSFSSHIQREDLIKFILQTNTSDYTILVHGDLDGRFELEEDLQKRYDDECISTKIIIPKKNQVIYF
jgi:metallo-beta-lactamase family protein